MTIDYFFYLLRQVPALPVHVAKNEQFVTSAQPFTFNVVDKPTKIDTTSWIMSRSTAATKTCWPSQPRTSAL
jgi:hypothetical protein